VNLPAQGSFVDVSGLQASGFGNPAWEYFFGRNPDA